MTYKFIMVDGRYHNLTAAEGTGGLELTLEELGFIALNFPFVHNDTGLWLRPDEIATEAAVNLIRREAIDCHEKEGI